MKSAELKKKLCVCVRACVQFQTFTFAAFKRAFILGMMLPVTLAELTGGKGDSEI